MEKLEKLEKKKRVEVEMDSQDNLGEVLAEAINKAQGEKVAFFLDEDEDASQVTDWITTGNDLVDLSIANRPNAGIPVGRITELTGLEGSGKSLMAAHIIKATQQKGGMAVLFDTECAIERNWLAGIGVDVSKGNLMIVNMNILEHIFDSIEQIIVGVRKANKNRLVTIIVDSIAATSTLKEMAADHGVDGYATGKAIITSKAMRKITQLIAKQRVCLIFANQLRQKIGFVGLGDPWTTSGGKALAYHASLRLRLKPVGQIKTADKNVVGVKTKCTVIKNRMGPPLKSVEFNIFFDRGIDNYGNWLEKLLEWDVITNAKKEKSDVKKSKKEKDAEKEEDKKAKSLQFIMTVEGKEPETVVFEKKEFTKLIADRQECRDYLYTKLCDEFIMKYRTPSGDAGDDIEIDAVGEGMDE
jgi:recombination protein RecA